MKCRTKLRNKKIPDIIHFSGHGATNGDLVFENVNGQGKLVTKEAMAQTIMTLSDKVRLIFYNTCFSAMQAEHLFEEEVVDKVKYIDGIDKLTTNDIELYLDKLKEKSFLGDYSKEYEKNKRSLAIDIYNSINRKGSKEDILLSLIMKKSDDGSIFRQRIEKMSDAINENNNFNMKRFLVLLYCLDVIGNTGLKLSVFFSIYPMNAKMQEEFLIDLQEFTISNINLS